MEDVRSDRKLKERLINLYNRLHSKYTPKLENLKHFLVDTKLKSIFKWLYYYSKYG